jgi:hypothetical protein
LRRYVMAITKVRFLQVSWVGRHRRTPQWGAECKW